MSGLGAIISAALLLRLFLAVPRGEDGPAWWAVAFWSLALVANVYGFVAACRALRDPAGEAERLEGMREQALAQPRHVLIRKAAVVGAVVSLAPIIVGMLILVLADSSALAAWALIAIGVASGAYCTVALRRFVGGDSES